jgi:hypothetical protein
MSVSAPTRSVRTSPRRLITGPRKIERMTTESTPT